MTISELIAAEPGNEFTISNIHFTYTGRARIVLEGGDVRYWLYDDSRAMLAISEKDEELVFFQSIDEELEPEDGIVLFHGEEYEDNYQDAGRVTEVLGELGSEEEDAISFVDYQNADGKVVRMIINENSGESQAFGGHMVVEEDVKDAK